MEIKFTIESLKKLEAEKKKYPTEMAALMSALWIAQEQFGWLSIDVMRYVADLLHLPHEHVFGVAGFYTMYDKKPIGKFHIQVCTNVSCMLCGGYEVMDYISQKLKIQKGETTGDNLFTLNEAECLGSCGTAPMMQVNNYFEENLTSEKIDKIITDLSK